MNKKEIKTVAFIGLGALGTNFAYYMNERMPKGSVQIILDEARKKRYQQEGIYYNDQLCDFTYISEYDVAQPVDLAIFCTKFGGLQSAMKQMERHIDEHTLILSAINGISSEEVLAQMYPQENIVYCVAQGMDATKWGNHISCAHIGELCIGDAYMGKQQSQIECIHEFFKSIQFPHTIKDDIRHHQWSKFMYNVGLNQVIAIHNGTYATVQGDNEARKEMIRAMEEVLLISKKEGIDLREAELQEWLRLTDELSPDGKPSMAQDVEARRYSEIDLFSGTVLQFAQKYRLNVPMNEYLYQKIREIEAAYAND